MPTEVKLPHLGESIDSAVVVAWHKSAGDGVKRGDELADLETDKATLSLEAPKNGVLLAIVADEGKTVYIGDLLAVIGRDGELWSAAPEADEEKSPDISTVQSSASIPAEKPGSSTKYKISPVARRKAKDLGVDLAAVQPADGVKISGADVEALASASSTAAEKPAQRRIELSQVKRLTGQRMLQSAQTVPQFSLTIDADAGQLFAARSNAKAAAQDLSLTAILIQIVAKTLGEHCLLNARFEDDGITIFESIHMGVATATTDGLRVPVIRDAERLSLEQSQQQSQGFDTKGARKSLTVIRCQRRYLHDQ